MTDVISLSPKDLHRAVSRNLLMIAPDSFVIAAATMMKETDSSYVLVVDSKENPDSIGLGLVGILTECDIVRIVSQERSLDRLMVQSVMSHPVTTIQESELTNLNYVLSLFQEHQIQHLPVLDRELLVGLLVKDTLTEIFMQNFLHLKVEPINLPDRPAIATRSDRTEPVEPYFQEIQPQAPKDIVDIENLNVELRQTIEELRISGESLMDVNLQLEIEQHKYQDLFDFAPDGYLVTNPSGIILSANQAIIDLLELNLDFLVGKPLVVFVVQSDHALFYDQIDRRLLPNQKHTWELSFKSRLGKQFPAEVTVVSICDHSNTVIGLRWLIIDISDLKATEEAVQEKEQFLRSIYEEVDQAIFTIDVLENGDFRYVEFNPAAERLSGKSTAEIKGNSANPKVRQNYINCVQAGVAITYEECLIFQETETWWLTTLSPIRDLSSRIYRIVGTSTNITERKKAEEMLAQQTKALEQLNQELEYRVEERTASFQKSETRYRALMDNASDAIFLADSQGNLVEANKKAEELLGYSRDELNHLHMSQIHPPAALAVARNHFLNVIENRFSPSIESLVLRKDGSQVPVDITGSKIDLDGEQIAQGIFRDISDRKRAESALIDSQKRYQALFNHKSDAVFINSFTETGRPSNFIEVNDTACESLGYSRAELLMMNPSDIMPKDFFCKRETIEILRTQKYAREEILHQTKDGKIFPVELSLVELEDSEGKPLVIATARNISDRKQAELALEQEALRRIAIFNACSDGIHIIDMAGNLLESNDKFAQMLGYTPSEVVNLNIVDWDAQWNSQEIREVLSDSSFNNCIFETIHRCKDGSTFPVEISRQQMEWQGEFVTVNISRDLSDRKQTELELQKSQRFTQQIADASPNILYLYDIQEQRNVYTNREILSVLGYSPETIQAMGANFAINLLHPDDLSSVLPTYYEKISAAQDGEVVETEYRMRHVNGEWRWLYSRDSVFSRDADGKVKRTIGTAQDISDRKRLEREQNRLIAILEASTDYISMSDAKGKVFWKNLVLKNLFGIDSNKDLLEYQITDCHPQWASELILKKGIPQAIATGSWIGETALLNAEGQEIPVSQLILAHKSSSGEIKYFSFIMRDIQVRKEYEQKLEKTNAELLRATRLKDEFLATMSHELRTPLNAILGMNESLQEQIFGTVNERQIKALQTIERSSNHLLELINDILELAKIEAGHIDLSYIPTSINRLCYSSLAFVKQQAAQKRIQIDVQISPNLPDIPLDERRICQVLINLLSNAVKFTPEGGLITLKAYKHEEDGQIPNNISRICLTVTDTGIGIASENLHKLFHSFVQIDSALNRKYAGTGLGLALVKRLVELHGGTVSVTSELGVGSCFTIALPYSNSDLFLVAPEASTVQNSSIEVLETSPLVLLVEDNEANITTISNYLEAKGYQILSAQDGREAIAIAKTRQPDVILMDIQMPVMDGLEAIKQIRLDPNLVNTPIIALTALAMKDDREKCLEAGANHYLAKPVKLNQLVTIIQSLLA